MGANRKLPDAYAEPLTTTITRFCVVVAFSIAFANIEASVVVYLKHIFHPDGFKFPMTVFGEGPLLKRFLYTEMGREAATMVLILTTCWLAGRNRQQRLAYFIAIFAVWDIFYYVWLWILSGWPASIMDWDILFLIPVTWASGLIIVASFCIVGVHSTEPAFESYFYRSLFAAGLLLGILTFAKCCLKSGQNVPETSV